jgi:hypothetical protein
VVVRAGLGRGTGGGGGEAGRTRAAFLAVTFGGVTGFLGAAFLGAAAALGAAVGRGAVRVLAGAAVFAAFFDDFCWGEASGLGLAGLGCEVALLGAGLAALALRFWPEVGRNPLEEADFSGFMRPRKRNLDARRVGGRPISTEHRGLSHVATASAREKPREALGGGHVGPVSDRSRLGHSGMEASSRSQRRSWR